MSYYQERKLGKTNPYIFSKPGPHRDKLCLGNYYYYHCYYYYYNYYYYTLTAKDPKQQGKRRNWLSL